MHRVVFSLAPDTFYEITSDKPIRFPLLRVIVMATLHRLWHLVHEGRFTD